MRQYFFFLFLFFLACGSLEKQPLIEKKPFIEKTIIPEQRGNDKVILTRKTLLDSLLKTLPNFDFPFTESIVKPMVKIEEGFCYPSDIMVEKKIYNYPRLFNKNKSDYNLQNEDYIYDNFVPAYYPCYKYVSEYYVTIGSLVTYLGENDTPGIYFIIFNFSEKGEQLDYLIVYNKIAYDTSIEYDIKIDQQLNIDLDILFKYYYDHERDGYIEDWEEPFRERKKEYYKTSEEGFFTLVKK